MPTPQDAKLPPFRVRRSDRARQARITITPRDGVVLVIPSGLDLDAAAVVAERRDWIEAALRDLGTQRDIWLADLSTLLPSEIAFALTGESWRVRYRLRNTSTLRHRTQGDTVTLSGPIDDAGRCLATLHRWLQARARERLLPRAATLAERFGVTPSALSVRGQHERWGGCSKSGHITLNRALLFLDAELVDAVIAHELAHVTHPDHSTAFWDELRRIDVNADRHRAELRLARDNVPPWVERH